MAPDERRSTRRYVVAEIDEIAPGGRKIVEIERREIGVFNVDGEFFAIRNRCPHQGAELCRGRLLGTLNADLPGAFRYDSTPRILQCLWHGWEFDVTTGQSLCDPQRLRAGAYPVRVYAGRELDDAIIVAGRTYLPGPYQAEVYTVLVTGNYVVIELA